MLTDVEYTTFKMFVTKMSNYHFFISFQLMFYKTLRCHLARALHSTNLKIKYNPSIHTYIAFMNLNQVRLLYGS